MERILRVSIADDDVRACDALAKSLNRLPSVQVVDHAYDGASALQAIAEHMPDLALLDVIMPQLDALGVMEEMRDMRLVKVPRVLLFVSDGQESIARRAMDRGAEGLLMRPVSSEKVLEAANDMFHALPGLPLTCRTLPEGSAQDALVRDALDEIGVPAHLKGYGYLRDAIGMVYQNIDLLDSMTKVLYPMIAMKRQSTNSRVERSIRHAIERCWDAGNIRAIQNLFGNSVSSESGKPTNSEFIARMSEYVRLSGKD